MVWFDRSLRQLIEHIGEHHHGVSLESLARGAVLFDLVAEADAVDPEILDPLRFSFYEFVNVLVPHSEREQRILFPYIEAMEDAWERGTPPPPRFEGGLRKAVAPVWLDHETLSELLRRLRAG
ncbi:MAG TPA: hypothetical protein VG323_19835, partial [Thermoanaerobaculia bacterium]|nr:hypothetical protein [Thermoanaerobaculia bacterium]